MCTRFPCLNYSAVIENAASDEVDGSPAWVRRCSQQNLRSLKAPRVLFTLSRMPLIDRIPRNIARNGLTSPDCGFEMVELG